MTSWIVEMRPKEWDVDKFVRSVGRGATDPELAWAIEDHAEDLEKGDRVYLWRAGDHKVEGIVALARVKEPVKVRDANHAEFRKAAFEEQYGERRPRALLTVEAVLSKPLYRVKLEWTDETKTLSVIGAKDGATFKVKRAEDKALEKLCEPLAQPVG